jgi:excisionase family DNA binding protein
MVINNTMKEKEFYTAKELADKFQVNIMTIYRYIKAKKLKAYKIGKEFRIDRVEFNRFLEKAKIK